MSLSLFSPADRSCPRGILQGLWFNHRWGSECVGQESNPRWLWWLHQTLLPRQIWHRYGKHYCSAVDFFISVLLKRFALFLWTGLSTEKNLHYVYTYGITDVRKCLQWHIFSWGFSLVSCIALIWTLGGSKSKHLPKPSFLWRWFLNPMVQDRFAWIMKSFCL